MDFRLLFDYDVELAETPIWDVRIKKWYWTDLFLGKVHRYDPVTQEDEVFDTCPKGKDACMIGSAIPCEDENFLLCVNECGVQLLDLITGSLSLVTHPETDVSNRYNDSRVDKAGRLLFSSVSKHYGTDKYHPDMKGTFYLLDTDHKTVVKLIEGIEQYNAIVWNSDSSKMYVIDTYNQQLISFDYSVDSGPLSGPNVALDLKPYGMPDGMSIDTQDNLYICHWSGKITVWDKTLSFVKEIKFPVQYVCCGGFGGEDMRDFYVATSKYCYTPEQLKENPGAGGIFSARSDIPGCPDNFFR